MKSRQYRSEYIQVKNSIVKRAGHSAGKVWGHLAFKLKYFTDEGRLSTDGSFYQSVNDIASNIQYSPSTVKRAIVKLRKIGVVKTIRKDVWSACHFLLNPEEIKGLKTTTSGQNELQLTTIQPKAKAEFVFSNAVKHKAKAERVRLKATSLPTT